MTLSAEEKKRFDDNEKLARSEFNQHHAHWSATAVSLWWDKWYVRAGHTRLGRILVDHAATQRGIALD